MEARMIFDLVTVIVAVIGIPLVLVALHHARSANFVAAWLSIQERLQSPNVVCGRVILRCLAKQLNAQEPTSEAFLKAYATMEQEYSQNAWWPRLKKAVDQLETNGAKAKYLGEMAAEAVGEFDLVSILAIHSRIPGLLDVVVLEWLDNIIDCFEKGQWVVCRRINAKRMEQFQCFSLLYVRAVRRKRELDSLNNPALVGDPYPGSSGWWARHVAERRFAHDVDEAARKRQSLCAG